ncbi:MAG TPA: glycosyltransferase [bacterium]|jgi:glycosyltransferase involved in cell wall biosynthesis|nr:glycosyltransferase [bacterium]
MPDVSVIIPTYNNRDALARALQSLLGQTMPAERYEIIVLDDGSTDGTQELVEKVDAPVRLRYQWQPNRGRSAARNAAADLAGGAVLLFLDSDIVARADLVQRHWEFYQARTDRIGVQGRTVIHPDCKVTFFMKTKELTPDLTWRRHGNMSPYHVVTRNLSIRAEDFRAAGGFDEGFVGYGWEDIELGLRMHRTGVRFLYDPKTVGYHYEIESLERTRSKLREAGESAVYFWRKLGSRLGMGLFLEIHPLLLPLKWTIYRTRLYGDLVRRVLPWAERRQNVWVANECYNYLIWESYYDGVFPALRNGMHPAKTDVNATYPIPETIVDP